MTRVENLIVEGKCFFPFADIDKYKMIKQLITEFMAIQNYFPNDNSHIFYQSKFLTISFSINMPNGKISSYESIKCSLGLNNKNEISQKKYFKWLENRTDDSPFMIYFYIIPSKIKDDNGFLIQIRSEPTVLFKMRQLGHKPIFDEFLYSNIIDANRRFIDEIMFSLPNVIVIEKPKAISEFILTSFIDKLDKLRFDKTAQLFKQGNLKLERGDIDDGLTDLRGALEEFIKEIVKKINVEPEGNIRNNLDILKKYGYIDEHLHSIIQNTLYDWVYRHISNTSVHKREKLNIIDAKLLFSVSEIILNCLIEKVIFRG